MELYVKLLLNSNCGLNSLLKQICLLRCFISPLLYSIQVLDVCLEGEGISCTSHTFSSLRDSVFKNLIMWFCLLDLRENVESVMVILIHFGVTHLFARMFFNFSLVLPFTHLFFCFAYKYKRGATKIFIGYARLLFVNFSGIPGCL